MCPLLELSLAKITLSLNSSSVSSTRGVFKLQDFRIIFREPIAVESVEETDDEFRERVIFARDNSNSGHINAIRNTMNSIPVIDSFVLYENARGTGTIDIGFTTADLMRTGQDTDIDKYVSLLHSRVREIAPAGVDISYFYPTQVTLNMDYTFTSNEAVDSFIVSDAIHAAVQDLYEFSEDNTIEASDIEEDVLTRVPVINEFTISSMSLFDSVINLFIYFGSRKVVAPKGTFIRSVASNYNNVTA